MNRPTPALVVAAMALLVALSGSAGAAISKLITGRDIKNGSIGLVDLSPAAKSGLRGRVGPQGPSGAQGAAGPAGPAGPAGAAGGFDPRKVVRVEGRITPSSQGNIGQSVATCPPGTTVVGGGHNVTSYQGGGFIILESRARDAAGWYVRIHPDPLAGSPAFVTFFATAICAAP